MCCCYIYINYNKILVEQIVITYILLILFIIAWAHGPLVGPESMLGKVSGSSPDSAPL